jgi:hypothetical protein
MHKRQQVGGVEIPMQKLTNPEVSEKGDWTENERQNM